MANRDQILEPVIIRSFDQRDDVAFFALPENDSAVRQPRAFSPQRLARIVTLLLSENPDFRHYQSCLSNLLLEVDTADVSGKLTTPYPIS